MAFFWITVGKRIERPVHGDPVPDPIAVSESKPAKKSPYTQATKPAAARKPASTASQIMRFPVRTLSQDAPFQEARDLFRQSRFRHVPIVNATGDLVGIISDRDVLREAAAMNENVQNWLREVVQEGKTIKDFMIKRVLAATPRSEIRLIAKVMFEERIGSMPVIDDDGRLVGIITRSDILRTIVNNAPLELWV